MPAAIKPFKLEELEDVAAIVDGEAENWSNYQTRKIAEWVFSDEWVEHFDTQSLDCENANDLAGIIEDDARTEAEDRGGSLNGVPLTQFNQICWREIARTVRS